MLRGTPEVFPSLAAFVDPHSGVGAATDALGTLHKVMREKPWELQQATGFGVTENLLELRDVDSRLELIFMNTDDASHTRTSPVDLWCACPRSSPRSRVKMCGAPSPVNPLELFGESIKMSGFAVTMMYALTEHHRRALDDVFQLEREGKLTVPIGGRFPLADAVEAHRFLEPRRSTGKLLLILLGGLHGTSSHKRNQYRLRAARFGCAAGDDSRRAGRPDDVRGDDGGVRAALPGADFRPAWYRAQRQARHAVHDRNDRGRHRVPDGPRGLRRGTHHRRFDGRNDRARVRASPSEEDPFAGARVHNTGLAEVDSRRGTGDERLFDNGDVCRRAEQGARGSSLHQGLHREASRVDSLDDRTAQATPNRCSGLQASNGSSAGA